MFTSLLLIRTSKISLLLFPPSPWEQGKTQHINNKEKAQIDTRLLPDLNGINTEISMCVWPWWNLTGPENSFKLMMPTQGFLLSSRPTIWLTFRRLRLSLKTRGVTPRGVLEKGLCSCNPVSACAHTGHRSFHSSSAHQQKYSYSGQIFFFSRGEGRIEGEHTKMIREGILKSSCGRWKAVLLCKWFTDRNMQFHCIWMFSSPFPHLPRWPPYTILPFSVLLLHMLLFFSSSTLNESGPAIQVNDLHSLISMCSSIQYI